ncbi:MAG TPA: NADH-quinone oxidoreductase subunit NuoG [Burkholderiales bacterium]|nr:NADH-quinone oxidoreductase subunit NuoG [Burkholderiales bacterium]
MVQIEINGRPVEVPDGTTVIQAAQRLGIYVPHFCYHDKLTVAANCRMCLVEIEKTPKPLPACATPVANGMKIWTHSPLAIEAQRGVMEFLLINHPLDCPICDQGGECDLQDLAVGYGGSGSRYDEPKRVVTNKNLGPLIATDMTRCIQCTRCVRFGQEIAGIMELGMIGRGEHAEITAFIGRTVDSELSGNEIDLCPVGALTSKPFRYTARSWELTRHPSVSPHCGLGSNLTVQVKQNRVMRVLPRDNEEINECWLSDKDRFSYEALNSADRLVRPLIRQDGRWSEVDWPIALEFVAAGLRRVRDRHGAQQTGWLATPHQTVEELYLLQKLAHGFSGGNIDFRLRQSDFSADGRLSGAPWLGMKVAELPQLDRALVIGSTLRKDHPLLAQRFRQAAKKQLQLNVLHAVDDDLLMRVANKLIAAPSQLPRALAEIVKAAAAEKNTPLPADVRAALAAVEPGAEAQRIAASLASGNNVGIFLGNFAQHHPAAAQLHLLTQALADVLGARFGFLGEAANSAGGYLAGALPGDTGLNARTMLEQPRKAFVLLGVEPEFDCHDGVRALAAMQDAEFVVALSPYQHRALDYAHALLPIAPFTETSGTFVSTEGRVQGFRPVVQPLAETRPAWKVLRVLGNLLDVTGFDYDSSEAVLREALGGGDPAARLDNRLNDGAAAKIPAAAGGVERIGEVPIYQADALARRAPALQQTRDAAEPAAAMHGTLFAQLGLRDGDSVRIGQGGGSAVLAAARDDRLPENCIRVPAAHPLTVELGALSGTVSVERVEQKRKVAV